MFEDIGLKHTRWIGAFITSIGFFLIFSMLNVASSNPAALTGVVFTTFAAGIVAGTVIATAGAVLFVAARPRPSDCE